MQIFTEEACCDLCGGTGVATPRGATSRWLGGKLFHTDRSICEDNIRRKREADARRIAELEQKLAAAS